MWDLSQKSEVFDLTSKSQLLWCAMLVKECTYTIWSCQQESVWTVFCRTPPMTLWMALKLLSSKRCLCSSVKTLESVMLQKEGLIGGKLSNWIWKTGSNKYSYIWWQCGLRPSREVGPMPAMVAHCQPQWQHVVLYCQSHSSPHPPPPPSQAFTLS